MTYQLSEQDGEYKVSRLTTERLSAEVVAVKFADVIESVQGLSYLTQSQKTEILEKLVQKAINIGII